MGRPLPAVGFPAVPAFQEKNLGHEEHRHSGSMSLPVSMLPPEGDARKVVTKRSSFKVYFGMSIFPHLFGFAII